MASKIQEKVRVPAPILAIIHITIAILLGKLLPIPLPAPAWMQWFSLGLAALGFILGVMALIEFRRVRNSPGVKSSSFVSSGIYRYTRNPVYLGFVFMLIGLPLTTGNYWGCIMVWPLVVFMNNFVIKPEEVSLEKRYKNQYMDYKAKVRRWL
jgi:protein-S-isoprenylcysteine O-methyltransferase Ste14